MKKLILLAIALIGFTSISNAQDIKFGVKGGVNFASFNSDETTSEFLEGRTGFHIGLVTEFGFSDSFSLQPEVLYSSQGANPKIGDGDIKIDYLNIPILVKYKFLKLIDVHAGPQFGIKVSEGKDIDPDELESLDISAAIGAGVKFSKFFGQIRYNHGLTDVAKDDGGELKNSVFQISVGYYIF